MAAPFTIPSLPYPAGGPHNLSLAMPTRLQCPFELCDAKTSIINESFEPEPVLHRMSTKLQQCRFELYDEETSISNESFELEILLSFWQITN